MLVGFGLILVLAVPTPIPINRSWDVLTSTDAQDHRAALREAGHLLGGLAIDFTGVPMDGSTLRSLADQSPSEPIVRVVREMFRRPVDLDDFLLFLDDLLRAKKKIRGTLLIPPGRARYEGILLHPHDLFKEDKPRRYAQKNTELAIHAPAEQAKLRPPKNRSALGPRWTVRYQQPKTEMGRLNALSVLNPTFRQRLQLLIEQLRKQGTLVEVESTVRKRERGYLIYGCYLLSRAETAREVRKRVRKLKRFNRRWRLNIPIRWYHPRGWRATIRAAKKMAETYNVDYATAWGARHSDHYDGKAIDFIAMGLPRKLKLRAPDGAQQTFDLSAPEQSRDLSLTPEVIEWVEEHFHVKKLRKDYPHWSDDTETTD